MLVVPKITGDLPAKNIADIICDAPDNIRLADPLYHVPQRVDILIGATHFYDLLCDRKIKPNLAGPIFQETKLGWVVSGSERKTEALSSTTYHSTLTRADSNLENVFLSFWCTEEFNNGAPRTAEEKICKKYFDETM